MVFCNGPVHRAEAASRHSALPSALSPSAAFCAAAIFTYNSSGLWGCSLMLYSSINADTSYITRLSAWLTRMGSPPMVQLNRYRLSVRSPSTQNRPIPYHRK